MGKWFGPQTGDCSCCIEDGANCGCTAGTYPANCSVELQGWTDDAFLGCDACDEAMGVYVLSSAGVCEFFYTDGQQPCGTATFDIDVIFSDDGTNTVVTITVYYGPPTPTEDNWIQYKKTFSGRVDCSAFSNEGIPYFDRYDPVVGNGTCDYGITIDDALLTTS